MSAAKLFANTMGVTVSGGELSEAYVKSVLSGIIVPPFTPRNKV